LNGHIGVTEIPEIILARNPTAGFWMERIEKGKKKQ
jgi:hypothetical protein